MLAVIYGGAAVALSYAFCLDPGELSDCYARECVLQIGFVLMFSALEAKTWRLHCIQEGTKSLKRVAIRDKDLFVRIAITTLVVALSLTVLFAVFPLEMQQDVADGTLISQCAWQQHATSMYYALLFTEMSALFMIGRFAWSLRTTNEVYNESKFIGAIILGTVLLIISYVAVNELVRDESSKLAAQSVLVSLLVLTVLCVLMLPKFVPIMQGTKYVPDSLQQRVLSFSASSLSKSDVRKMQRHLRKFGYSISENDDRKQRPSLGTVRTDSSASSRSKPYSSSNTFKTQSTDPQLDGIELQTK